MQTWPRTMRPYNHPDWPGRKHDVPLWSCLDEKGETEGCVLLDLSNTEPEARSHSTLLRAYAPLSVVQNLEWIELDRVAEMRRIDEGVLRLHTYNPAQP